MTLNESEGRSSSYSTDSLKLQEMSILSQMEEDYFQGNSMRANSENNYDLMGDAIPQKDLKGVQSPSKRPGVIKPTKVENVPLNF